MIIVVLFVSVLPSYGLGRRRFKKIPPRANAGVEQTMSEGVTAILDGSASLGGENAIRSYSWEQISGPQVNIFNPWAAKSTIIVPAVNEDGTSMVFRLTVTDNKGLQASDTCVVKISYENQPPVADAGKGKEVSEGDTVSLSASTSSDPDDGIKSYRWMQISGTNVQLSSQTSPTPSFYVPNVGKEGDTLTFRLIVTDNGGLSSSATCHVYVKNQNKAPLAEAGADQIIKEGTTGVLHGAKSSDADGDNLSYAWTQTGGTRVDLSSMLISTPTFSTPDVGSDGETLTFKLTVTDSEGLTSTDTCAVKVVFVNQPPIADAGKIQTVKEGNIAVLSAENSTDSDDSIVSYLWEQVAGPEVQLSDPFAIKPTFITPDVDENGLALTFRLTVTDKGGLKSTDACIVNVFFVNEPPHANAGANQIVSEGNLTTLNAGNSIDPDGNIQSYLWEQIDGPKVILSDILSVRPTFIAPDTGVEGETLVFKVTVSDTGGVSSYDTSSVKVVFINQPPIADAGITQTVPEGSKVTLNGSGSKDPDDGIKSYFWKKIAGPDVSLSNTSSAMPEFIAPEVGSGGISLTFELTVSDKNGLKSLDACIVNVSHINTSPVADAGANQVVAEKSIVTLNAVNSSDSDDGIASYEWRQTAGANVVLSDTSLINPTFKAPETAGDSVTLAFSVTVTDKGGLKSSDTSTVTVIDSGNKTIAFSWDTNVDADYYVVYWGQASRNYTNNSPHIKIPETSYTITGLDQALYYFAVKAFNSCGNSSDFSKEITWNFDTASTVSESSGTLDPVTETGFIQPLPEGVINGGNVAANGGNSSQPVSPSNLISFLTDSPSIEILDTNFKHLEWLQTGWSEYNILNGEVRVSAGDIDGDGEDEFIIGFAGVDGNKDIPAGFFQILDHDFTHLAWGQINWPEYNEANGETWPVCGDINDDGDDEIIVGLGKGGEGTMEVFDYDSNGLSHIEWVISSWSEYNRLIGETRPAVGDIDGDGFEEIIIGMASDKESNSMPGGYFEMIESDYSHGAWGNIEWPEYNTANGETWLACGDISGNGSCEIIAGLGSGGNGLVEIFEYQETAVLHNSWLQVDWPEYNNLNGETRPCSSDIDNDGKDEIIIGLGPISENTSIPGGRYQVNDDDYSLIEWLQLDWPSYNTANGSTRPVSAILNDSRSILIGLGEK